MLHNLFLNKKFYVNNAFLLDGSKFTGIMKVKNRKQIRKNGNNIYKNGNEFNGYWRNNEPYIGMYINKNPIHFSNIYKTISFPINYGIMSTEYEGTITYINEKKFIGSVIVNNNEILRNGYGELIFPNGNKINGIWKNNNLHILCISPSQNQNMQYIIYTYGLQYIKNTSNNIQYLVTYTLQEDTIECLAYDLAKKDIIVNTTAYYVDIPIVNTVIIEN